MRGRCGEQEHEHTLKIMPQQSRSRAEKITINICKILFRPNITLQDAGILWF